MTSDNTLETKLTNLFYDVEMEWDYFNDTYTGVVHLMKKVVEDESYRIQLYDIGKEEIKITGNETFQEYSIKYQKKFKNKFGLEDTLYYTLQDSQLNEEGFNRLFTEIVNIMKKLCEDKDYVTQLYKINLDNYKNDEE